MSKLSKSNALYFSAGEVSAFKGSPLLLVEDEVFFKLRTEEAFRKEFLDKMELEEITVGRLGIRRENGFFFLPEESPVIVAPPKRRSLGEYLRLGAN